MPLGAAITVLVIGVAGLAFTGYLTVRFIAAWRRGEMRLSAFNSFTGKWVDPDERDDRRKQRDSGV